MPQQPKPTDFTEHLIEQLHHLINNEARRITSDEESNHDRFEMMVFDLRRLVGDAKLLVDDYKSQGLTFNTIEAEGFLRAMLTIEAVLDEHSD
jgi:hypothetical protein